ncbi:MAG: tetratricopeptide repeat protein [Bacteroidetes bacterium]|nr:tetratricopeptide repeat protein [Bacteroidota bacterium]
MYSDFKLFFITSFVIVGSIICASGQTQRIHNLKEAAQEAKSEKEKADLYVELAETLYSHNFEQGVEYAKKSLETASKADYRRGVAQALTSIGNYYYYKGDNKKSQQYFYKALAETKNSHFDDYPSKTYIRLSILYREQAFYDSAKIYFDKAWAILQNQKSSSLHASYFASSGILANAMAQNDEALVLLKKSMRIRMRTADTARLADTWRNLGVVYSDLSQFDSAEYCFSRGRALLKKINDPQIQMTMSLSQGETNFLRGNFNESIKNYEEALDLLKANNYKRYYAYLLYKIGEVYENQGAYHTAYDYLFDALKEFESINARQDMARTYTQIGWCYNYQENYTLAIENANKAIGISVHIPDSASIAQNQNLIGYALLKTKKYPEAQVNFEQALITRKKIKNWWGVSYTLYNMALLNIEIGETKRAFDLLSQSLETAKRIGNKGGVVFACNELGLLFAKTRQYEKAAYYLNEAKIMAKKIPLPTQLITNYKNFIFLYEQKNDSRQTIVYYKLYTKLKDSLSNEISSSRIAKADALFQLQKKANEIQLINKENELQGERISRQQNEINFQQKVIVLVTISLLVLLVLLIVIYRLLKSRTRAKEKLSKQNIEIVEQKEEIQAQSEELTEANSKFIALNQELIEKNHEIELQSDKIKEANVNLEKRVAERTSQLNVAYQELETFFYRTSHDFRRPLTTYLGLVQIAKATIKNKEAIDLFDKVQETTSGLDNMLIKLQSISNIDFENQSSEYSLNSLLSQCVEKHRAKIEHLGITVIIDNEDKSVHLNEHLFKTALENIIENSINFCTPINPYIRIITSVSNTTITVLIEDNGQGISASIQHKIFEMYFRGNDNSKGNGLGLYIAKRAVDKLGGSISFISRLNEGTSFKITLPVV